MSEMTMTTIQIIVVIEKEGNDELDARLCFDRWFWYDDVGLKTEGFVVTERVNDDDDDDDVVLILIGGPVVVVVDGRAVLTSLATDMSAILLCCCTTTWTPTQMTS